MYRQLMDLIRDAYIEILGANLAGIYVHGSIAFGCYDPKRSDIDFLIVTRYAPTLDEKMAMIDTLLRLYDQAPQKGFEMSVVLCKYCRDFVYPTPYELHYSQMYEQQCRADLRAYCARMHGTDKDLAAHFTVVRAVGVTYYGEHISRVFGPVPEAAYKDSIFEDIAHAAEDIVNDPVYVILNLCRVLAYFQDKKIMSKEAAGIWAKNWLPETYVQPVSWALQQYQAASLEAADKEKQSKADADGESLTDSFCLFADFMLEKIKSF